MAHAQDFERKRRPGVGDADKEEEEEEGTSDDEEEEAAAEEEEEEVEEILAGARSLLNGREHATEQAGGTENEASTADPASEPTEQTRDGQSGSQSPGDTGTVRRRPPESKEE